MILRPDRGRAPPPAPTSGIGIGSIRRILLIGMLLLAGGYRAGVHFGWITPLTARAPAAAAPGAGAPAAGSAAGAAGEADSGIPTVTLVKPDEGEVARAFEQHQSRVQVHGSGTVSRVLADDDEGSRHQRFILRMDSGQNVLFAHNIDLAGRVPGLTEGTHVEFSGEYEWNEKGGVVHWTHRDPAGRHPAGWLKVGGVMYR